MCVLTQETPAPAQASPGPGLRQLGLQTIPHGCRPPALWTSTKALQSTRFCAVSALGPARPRPGLRGAASKSRHERAAEGLVQARDHLGTHEIELLRPYRRPARDGQHAVALGRRRGLL